MSLRQRFCRHRWEQREHKKVRMTWLCTLYTTETYTACAKCGKGSKVDEWQ